MDVQEEYVKSLKAMIASNKRVSKTLTDILDALKSMIDVQEQLVKLNILTTLDTKKPKKPDTQNFYVT